MGSALRKCGCWLIGYLYLLSRKGPESFSCIIVAILHTKYNEGWLSLLLRGGRSFMYILSSVEDAMMVGLPIPCRGINLRRSNKRTMLCLYIGAEPCVFPLKIHLPKPLTSTHSCSYLSGSCGGSASQPVVIPCWTSPGRGLSCLIEIVGYFIVARLHSSFHSGPPSDAIFIILPSS
ncbi:hypothetical protein BO94DRAFT_71064 [Aspergillus sclerotioniger CBS 115572]|uniref:Uncharacterized protein n=1 Tax=Aspergillus sclerotioniger CBS 115572 TaxID=1450535 RepID=A0A317WLJ8_9EURO|nr:hypothetical protein BO94DRAFT_71064 [Aspergillus sclerotioniger CBS 115572]PWY87209.1 hypothetical protein BO94DRAFT_71064 [Aspergillus sclerotioniger CBS 115572]